MTVAPNDLLRGACALLLLALASSAMLFFGFGVDLLAHEHVFLPCPIRAVFGIECPGCGMTRGLLLLSQLRVAEACALQPAAPFLLGGMALTAFRLPAPILPVSRRARELTPWALLAIVCAAWIARVI